VKIWPTRRRVALAASHLAATLAGIAVASLLLRLSRPEVSFPLAALGARCGLTGHSAPCSGDLGPWVHDLIVDRESLGEDDFAVEAAVMLALVRKQRSGMLVSGDETILREAASRCPGVLGIPCDDAHFETAVARRCRPPKHRFRRRDSGIEESDGAPRDASAD